MLHIVKSLNDLVYTFKSVVKILLLLMGVIPTLGLKKM
jgi:hypothetical protein